MLANWDSSAVETLWAAVIAAIVGLVAIVISIVDGIATRRVTRAFAAREQSWDPLVLGDREGRKRQPGRT